MNWWNNIKNGGLGSIYNFFRRDNFGPENEYFGPPEAPEKSLKLYTGNYWYDDSIFLLGLFYIVLKTKPWK